MLKESQSFTLGFCITDCFSGTPDTVRERVCLIRGDLEGEYWGDCEEERGRDPWLSGESHLHSPQAPVSLVQSLQGGYSLPQRALYSVGSFGVGNSLGRLRGWQDRERWETLCLW